MTIIPRSAMKKPMRSSRMRWHASLLPPQQQRYGEAHVEEDVVAEEDADAVAEAELARQFAASQQTRYASEQPEGAHPFSLDDFEFSPMKTLVDDTPKAPLFTPGVMPEPATPQPQQYARSRRRRSMRRASISLSMGSRRRRSMLSRSRHLNMQRSSRRFSSRSTCRRSRQHRRRKA